jgi:ATP-dependent RNA helicase DeaD
MGRKGEAITLVTPRELRLLRTIERQIQKKLKPLRLPTPEDITARRREEFLTALRATLTSGVGEPYALLVEELAEDFDPVEIAAGALHLAFTAQTPSVAQASLLGERPTKARPAASSHLRRRASP